MRCPFCEEEVGSADELQMHCLVCTSACAESSSSLAPAVDCVVVRFRWVKSRPCFEREVHLISSLAGSVTLHWKEDESLYESDTIGVPVGEHICQLAVGGDVVPTETFEVNADSDVIFIIIEEVNFRYTTFEDSDVRARITGGDVVSDEETEPVDTHDRHQPPLDMETRERHGETSNEMSPLYRELLQHQLSHGEPSWVPGSGVQSPVMSETDFSTLAGQQDEEPPVPGTSPEELLPGLEGESHPGDLSGESDGVPSLPDGGGVHDQSDNEADAVLPLVPSFSPVPSSHSEHDSHASRDSPANSVRSETGARDDSVISPLIIVEAILRESPPPFTGGRSTEEENTTVPSSSTPQSTPGRDHDLPSTTEEHPTEDIQSASRASPLGSVLDVVTGPVNSDPDALLGDYEATTPPQRHSPAGSVHSSSLFSSGLPSPIMSPRDRSQSDTGVPLATRGNPPGSLYGQIQLPLRPQSLGGTVPTTAGLLTTLRGPRDPTSGAEESPLSAVHRQSPAGSNHSSIVHPQGGIGLVDLPQQQQHASRHSSQRSTPVVSAHSGSASERSTPSVHSPRYRTSGGGSPTELLIETAYRQSTPPEPFHTGPPVLPTTSHRESNRSTPVSHRSGTGSPTELLMETAYRRGTPAAPSSLTGFIVASPMATRSQLHHRDSENSTPSVHSPRHRTSGAEIPSELLAEALHAATPPVMPSTGSWVNHQESEHSTSLTHSSRHRTAGTGSDRETQRPPVTSQGGSSRSTSVHSRPAHSPPHVFSPPLPRESVIPSHGSAFATVTGERSSYARILPSEVEDLRQERDTLARELRQRAAHYEAELRRVKSRNGDLEQQLLSIETVANLTKQDDDKTMALEQTVVDLNRSSQEKDQEMRALQETVRGLERTNQQLKEEQESLKTVNELRLEDTNRLNSDLQQQLSDLRRRYVESSRAQRGRDEGKIIELQVIQNTLEQHVKRLELQNTNLHKQLKQAQKEMDTMKAAANRNVSRISKAKSETDLSRKFDKYSTYDKYRYADLEPVAKAVSFSTRGDASGLGTTRFSSLDTNYTRSRDYGVTSSPVIMNGYGSTRSDTKRAALSSYSSVHDRLALEPVSGRGLVPRHRGGSLGEDSDVSDDLEHASQPRYRTQSSESSSSSVVSWDHDYTAYTPVSSLNQQHDRETGQRRRPHSYHGGSLHDVYSSKDDHSSSQHTKTSPYTQSLRDVGRHSTSSSYNTNSPLLTAATHQPASSKLFTKPFAPTSSSDIQLGMEVLVTRSRGQIGRGKVKYVGPLPGRQDMYIGIELGPGQEGKHDGSLNGQRLFTCKPNRGIFVSFNKVVMCYG